MAGIIFAVNMGIADADKPRRNILEDGKIWITRSWDPELPFKKGSYFCYRVLGDSLMSDGNSVKAVAGYLFPSMKEFKRWAVYEKDDTLWGFVEEHKNFEMLLTFNVQEGYEYTPGVVESKIRIPMWNDWPEVIVFTDDSRIGHTEYWIEGVGSPTLLFMSPSEGESIPGFQTELRECWSGDELLYSKDIFEIILTSDWAEVMFPKDTSELPSFVRGMFDLKGYPLTTPQPGGVYIRDGKKFVWPR